MATIEKLSIALPAEMAAQIREAVEAGEYATASEVVRDALRDWKQKRALQQGELAELRRLYEEGRDSPTASESVQETLERIKKKYRLEEVGE